MTTADDPAHRTLFRNLPQRGLLCCLVRDEAGTVVDLEVVDVTVMGADAAALMPEALRGLRLMALSGVELVAPLVDQAARAAAGEPGAVLAAVAPGSPET